MVTLGTLIIYTKEKATDSNWYTYTWFLKPERITELMREKLEEEHTKINEKMAMEQSYVFFKCANGCDKLPFELAFEYDFKCPECGNAMRQRDSKRELAVMEKRATQIQQFLNSGRPH